MDKQNLSSPTKRFRSDLTNIRTKQTITNKQRTTQLPSYRNSNNYQKQQEQEQQQQQQNQIISSSPINENFDENNKQIYFDMDLNMNCFEEQLSDSQLAHCPVKVNLLFILN
jgi:uncharacterized glyoxalase superfamily metalloenzyme YdcJ